MSGQSHIVRLSTIGALAAALLISACSEIQKPQPEPFYAETVPPAKQEFRWSNGKMPRSFDPARAAAAPETDVVRALFEGLTEVDAKTLEAVPAAAEKWSSSDDLRVWTFQLRKGARWSNGKRVSAYDFVMSWKRLIALGDKTAHRELIQNIVGFKTAKAVPSAEPPELIHTPAVKNEPMAQSTNTAPAPDHDSSPAEPLRNTEAKKPAQKNTADKVGVEAVDDLTLMVSLLSPDKDLPKLVADPIFRPIYGDGEELADNMLDNGVVTNGAFKVALVDKTGVALDRSDTYWNKAAVGLEHVRFVAKDSAESALDAYKKGEIDALTNAEFEPLALKLLSPYEDFRQTTFSAVNLYKFDDSRPPFNDRRIREALALAIDRERLSNTEMEGVTEPAGTFLPISDDDTPKLAFDAAKAKKLLETAGFPNGEGIAPIKLLINRNDAQVRVARAVARMWKQNLNLDTEVTVKEPSEIDAAESLHEYDIVRHGVVLPTADEAVSLAAIFAKARPEHTAPTDAPKTGKAEPPQDGTEKGGPSEPATFANVEQHQTGFNVMTEEKALFELNAIPLYFPRSYSLVKPYVHGFEINGFDAPYLPGVSIDSNWQPKVSHRES